MDSNLILRIIYSFCEILGFFNHFEEFLTFYVYPSNSKYIKYTTHTHTHTQRLKLTNVHFLSV